MPLFEIAALIASAIAGASEASKSRKEARKARKAIPPPPAAEAEVVEDKHSDEIARRQRARVKGRRKTIVTGNLAPAQVGKKTLLGR